MLKSGQTEKMRIDKKSNNFGRNRKYVILKRKQSKTADITERKYEPIKII